jgi:hypothetical protein
LKPPIGLIKKVLNRQYSAFLGFCLGGRAENAQGAPEGAAGSASRLNQILTALGFSQSGFLFLLLGKKVKKVTSIARAGMYAL